MAGNENSGRRQEKPFRDALRMEIAAAEADDQKSLRAIARKMIEAAAEGKMDAIREIADRLDGKVAQQVIQTGDEEGGPVVHAVEFRIVRPGS